MTRKQMIDSKILEEAADWLLRLRDEDGAEIGTDFARWIEASAEHREAFDAMEEAWSLSGEVELKPGVRALLPVPAGGPDPLVGELVEHPRRRWPTLGHLSIAAVVLLTLGIAGALSFIGFPTSLPTHVERIVTERKQHQVATLPDGSRVELGGLSAVSVRFSRESRMIVVDAGETYYEVKKDPDRPFVVQAGPVTVTAIGTKFTVRREGEAISVIVTEGVVEVSADPSLRAKPGGETRTIGLTLRASAGERVRFDRGELSQAVEQLRPEVATSWRTGRLEFVDEPLRLVVAGVNRYSAQDIIIDDPTIGDLRFTGTVFENEIPSWLKAVETVFGLHAVKVDARRILITRRAPKPSAVQ